MSKKLTQGQYHEKVTAILRAKGYDTAYLTQAINFLMFDGETPAQAAKTIIKGCTLKVGTFQTGESRYLPPHNETTTD
jgi:hypothetical protein